MKHRAVQRTSRSTSSLAACFVLFAACSSPAPKQAPPPAPAPRPPSISLLAVGDIFLGRGIGKLMAKAGDYTLPFKGIAVPLAAADITFGNLEGPFCEQPPYTIEGMTFRVHPRGIEGLVAAGFDVVSVANNHFGDGGEGCMRFSLFHLRRNAIAPVGAGLTFEEAHDPSVITRRGVRFSFLGYSFSPRNDRMGSRIPAIAGMDTEQMRRDVAAARKQGDAVFVSIHDGEEYSLTVTPRTQAFARSAIDAGATAVLGHHPHVPQRIEAYRDGWIFYSLGNFVFWQNTPPSTRTSIMARLTFRGASLQQVEALPVVIQEIAQPRLATEAESERILKTIGLQGPLLWKRL